MRKLLLTSIIFVFLASLASAESGRISVKSAHDVAGTADRLEQILKEKGMTVFIRINHAEGARKVEKQLRPTELLLFGNPQIGTILMQCAQSIAIDLPQKALIWQDDSGEVWLTYNDPYYLARRHGLKKCGAEALQKVANALKNFAKAATQP